MREKVATAERRWGLSRVLLTSLSFFFSSRRRHTRCSRDWSSDVCSSDLRRSALQEFHAHRVPETMAVSPFNACIFKNSLHGSFPHAHGTQHCASSVPEIKIGRASCRERV